MKDKHKLLIALIGIGIILYFLSRASKSGVGDMFGQINDFLKTMGFVFKDIFPNPPKGDPTPDDPCPWVPQAIKDFNIERGKDPCELDYNLM